MFNTPYVSPQSSSSLPPLSSLSWGGDGDGGGEGCYESLGHSPQSCCTNSIMQSNCKINTYIISIVVKARKLNPMISCLRTKFF